MPYFPVTQPFFVFIRVGSPESYIPADTDPRTGKTLDVGIHGEEKPGNAEQNDGFFEKALLKALESNHVGKQQEPEVKVVGNGHCHCTSGSLLSLLLFIHLATVTENCRRVKGIWLCFGGGG